MTKLFLSMRIFGIIAIISVMLYSCTKDYANINTDKSAVPTVGESELPFLFSRAISVLHLNYQTGQNLFADQYAQYFACNASYFPSDRYVIDPDWATANFNPIYTVILPQLQVLLERKDAASAEAALANIWWVFAFHRVTDYWGPIPYFNIGVGGLSIPYDSQDKIYDDFFKRLAAAVQVLEGKRSEKPYDSFDLLYGGKVDKWIKFANTLRLRLAIRISKVDPARARTEAEAAYAGGVFTQSPDDDTYVPKNTLDINRLSQMSDWNEFRMSAAMESVLKGFNDPRMPVYFLPAKSTGTYEGFRNGLTPEQQALAPNSVNANSHVGARWTSLASGGIADHLSTPVNVMCAAEAYFLRAEGALLGWNMGGTAKDLYEQGIANSMIQWGITNNTVIQDYINGISTPIAPGDYMDSPPVSNIPVRFDAGNMDVQLEQIATQKWLALFPDGMEAWADHRRGHYNKLYPIVKSDNPDVTDPTTQWIRRLNFLQAEKIANGPAVEAAIGLLGGPDKITTPLWWDKN